MVISTLTSSTLHLFIGKKKLDKTALAGLAAKLDFTTVQLRKTGIVEQVTFHIQCVHSTMCTCSILYCACI